MNNTLTVSQPNNDVVIQQVIPTAEASIKPYLEALSGKRVMESSDIEIKAALSAGIHKAIFNLGQQPKSVEEITLMNNELLGELKTFCRIFTLSEIVLACQNGAKEAYGQNFGINVATVMRWMMGLLNDMKRQSAKKLIADYSKPMQTKPEPTEDEIKNTRIEIILNAFEKYQKTGFYDDLGNYVYDCLKTAKVINYTGKEVKEFIVQAISNLIAKKQNALIDCADLNEGRVLKRDIEYLTAEEVVVTAEIKAEAKRIMLFARFDEMIFEEVDLKTLLINENGN